jgi:outer membrane protein assembly factor BamB
MRHFHAGLLAVVCLAAPTAARAAQPQFWQLEGARDFLDGETEGLSVDSEGRVRLAPATRVLQDPEAPYVWSLARDSEGRLYVGTGNDGKVFRVEGGKASLLFDAPELEVHALAIGKDGRLYAGTAPDGKVYAIDHAGKSEVYFDPSDKYIWALAFDDQGRLLVASGAEGRIHRVTAKDKSEVLFTSPEGHITALAVDGAGNVYAGSTPGGVLYRIDRAGKVFVLHDSAYREVKAMDLAADGSLYAALIDGKDKEDSGRPSAPLLPATPSAPVGEVTVTESFTLAGPPSPSTPAPSPRPLEPIRSGSAKGAVVRVSPTGEVDLLWSSSDEMPHALAATEDGVLVGTGNKGKLYRVRSDRSWTMIAGFPAEQLTSLVRTRSGEVFLATANPGRVHVLEPGAGARGTFTSKAKDTDTVSSWGRVRWDAEMPAGTEIQVQTRSGNTGTPDSTWTPWSAPYTSRQGAPVASEAARFLQVRAILIGQQGHSPVLDTLVAAYLQRNLRPQLQSITVHPPGEVFQKPISLSGDVDILGLDEPRSPEGRPAAAPPSNMPSATAYSRRLYQKGVQTFSWRADDPNGDTLLYDVFYRPLGDNRFRLLKKGVTDAVLAWDTTTVPNGRYVVKVVASDAPSNPAAVALSGDKESAPFEVDNTPPAVTVTLTARSPLHVRVTVKDDSSIVRKTEYSIDGGKWQEVHPTDGINDSVEESYDFPLGELSGLGPHVVVVRASDLLGNLSTGRVEIP